LAEDTENERTIFPALRYNPNSHKPYYSVLEKQDHAEMLCDGLRVYHNPFATNPICASVFRRPEVFQLIPDHDNKEMVAEIREFQLIWRMAQTIRSVPAE